MNDYQTPSLIPGDESSRENFRRNIIPSQTSNGVKLTNTVYKVLEFFPESDPLKNRAKDKTLAIMENLILVNETHGWVSFQKEKIKVQLLEDIDILLGYLWIGKSQGWLNSVNCLIIANEYEKIKKKVEPIIELTQRLPGLSPTNFGFKKEELAEEKNSPKLVRDEQESPPSPKATEGQGAQISPSPILDNMGVDKETSAKASAVGLTESAFGQTQSAVGLTESAFGQTQSVRQGKILEFLSNNEKAQVMDLQTILPDITKRTIRRDLDELLESGKIIRLGEFNQVFYKIS